MEKIISINPSDKSVIGEVTATPKSEIENKVKQARTALKGWNEIGVAGRVEHLKRVVTGLKAKEKEFSELSSKEMGMPVSQSKHDVAGAIEYLEWYLDNAKKYLKPEIVYEDETQIHTVHREPVGVVAAITPWNFPASNFVWMCGQNLVAGNTVVFKDSEEVSLCGKLIEEIIQDANLPDGVFSEIYGDGEEGKMLVEQDIDIICFTGSTATGKALYKIAAEKFIKVFLELGGSAPGIILEDADIDKVIETVYANRFDNCGQICDGLKRLIVHESKYEEVIAKLTKILQSVTIGNASDITTDVGPLASEKQLLSLKAQVQDAVSKGARVAFESKLPSDLDGFYYPPTILTNISSNMSVWNEEVFGPVLPIMSFKTIDEAIALANDTKYGLGGYIFTEDKHKAEKISKQVKTGMIQMNNTCYVSPASPFGGCKSSGIGREHGKFGFYDLTELKLIVLEK